MKFHNGKSYEEVLNLSETHQIPFQKDNTDFFMLTIDDIGDNEVKNIFIRLIIEFILLLDY